MTVIPRRFSGRACARERLTRLLLLPNAGDGRRTFRTSTLHEPILEDIVPGTPDNQFVALGATRIRTLAKNISFVHVVKTRFQSDSPRPVKSLTGRARLILQLEVGM